MTEQPSNQDESARGQSFIEGLPTFPGDAEDAPPSPLPNRARTWGKYGALWGAICGGVAGTFIVLLSLLYGSPNWREAVGIFFGAPIAFGVLGGIVWGLRGAIRDHLMESRDLEKAREAERRDDEDREWHAVKRILKRKG
jgi:MFS family permease